MPNHEDTIGRPPILSVRLFPSPPSRSSMSTVTRNRIRHGRLRWIMAILQIRNTTALLVEGFGMSVDFCRFLWLPWGDSSYKLSATW